MSLLYKRIIEEIGDSHSELVEKFVRELSGETRGTVFQIFQFMYAGILPEFSSLTSSQKEKLERRIIEAIDDDVPDDQIPAMIETFLGELESGEEDLELGPSVPNL